MIRVPSPRIPLIADRTTTEAFSIVLRWLVSELGKRTPDDTVRSSVLLRSPDNSTWEATIDDAGVISTTKVSG